VIADFGSLGRNSFGPKKDRRKEIPFIFRKHFRQKQNNLEIAR
jgi:hypothetical protein